MECRVFEIFNPFLTVRQENFNFHSRDFKMEYFKLQEDFLEN